MFDNGLQPEGRIVWGGIDIDPQKINGFRINSSQLPTERECMVFAGLDVVLLFHGYNVRYGVIRHLCESITLMRPRRLQLVDLDYKRIAFLKMVGA